MASPTQDGPPTPPHATPGDGVPDRPAARHVPPDASAPSITWGAALPPHNHARRRPPCGPLRRSRVPVPAVAALVACAGGLLPRAARAQNPLYQGRVLAPSGVIGTERGITLEDERFWPGTTGSEWPKPEGTDQLRIEKKDDKQYTDWRKTSWRDVNCCRSLREDADWQNEETGVPDCFCRDLLQYTGYKTVAWCNLKQSCENALRDWNKVFGEGYMAEGVAVDWNTESPLRTCTSTDFTSLNWGKATHTSCGKKLTFDELKEKTKETGIDYQDEPYIWKDAFGRGPVYEGYDPSASYGRYLPPGTVDERGRELAADRNPRKAKPTGYTWVPGDVPLIKGGSVTSVFVYTCFHATKTLPTHKREMKHPNSMKELSDEKKWQGYRAANNAVEEGLMASSRVYPGVNHSLSCLQDANGTECLNSTRMKWRSPEDSFQADCMYAVKRAICAYHFWECDGSFGTNIYNGICQPTCDDIPKLCGTIPSTGEPLQVKRFTLGNYYHLGCTTKTREYVKDCTAGAERDLLPRTSKLHLLLFVGATVVLGMSH